MAATHSHAPDPVPEEKPAESDNMMEQPISAQNEKLVPPKSSQDAAAPAIAHPREPAGQLGSIGSGGDHRIFPSNVYAPQAQSFYYRGYENANGEWDEYPPYANAEGLEMGSPGVFNENPSLVYHPGYSYSPHPQMPYGPYSPVTPPLPSVGGDAQLYSPQQFPISGPPFYQQLMHPNIQYSPTPASQPEFSSLMSVDQQVDNMFLGPRPGYPPQLESFGRASFPGNSGTLGFHDLQLGFEGPRSGGIWSDWSKTSGRQRSLTPLSPALSPQSFSTIGSFGQNVGMASQPQRSMYGFGSGSNTNDRAYMNGGFNQSSSFESAPISNFGTNNRAWLSLEANRRRSRSSGSLCGCNAPFDILNEQNRGPRASKPKSQISAEHKPAVDSKKYSKSDSRIHDDLYNRPDFVTDCKDAKFFVIKSYSEDNVHKSIKYGVWASTPNGNKKLDAAYHEAKKRETCPLFLLFSVNASAQFCGVAEMVGPVDFDKSVDYWQQDKWSGQFPVKWHIIKDVPNSQFRHIVLENNDNKPVTNSRDTQEVKLEQGIEMLNIFKNYETDTSIVDDFDFYEDRQRTMQERKRQQANLMAVGVVGDNDHRNPVALSSDLIKQMSKSFAQVVQLDEGGKEGAVPDRASAPADTITAGVPTAQGS
ncbi:hypothetical protein HS088_TW22G00521 [Tripterygium wilfordii]|uniref:YTH domain-containing family protein n=1 Tax=Tripterygium wilfordii TaxID=458696 RepID=A0A7J7BYY2_TRIWF|nr:YTH domain-containing protein ECT4 isoform X2 [Tripterygium wilfordii]KAF5726837.1 hypothetical protein HS088_TW22G00521 [Tripterygium wilfordii]